MSKENPEPIETETHNREVQPRSANDVEKAEVEADELSRGADAAKPEPA